MPSTNTYDTFTISEIENENFLSSKTSVVMNGTLDFLRTNLKATHSHSFFLSVRVHFHWAKAKATSLPDSSLEIKEINSLSCLLSLSVN